jgi:hypothetical protein
MDEGKHSRIEVAFEKQNAGYQDRQNDEAE